MPFISSNLQSTQQITKQMRLRQSQTQSPGFRFVQASQSANNFYNHAVFALKLWYIADNIDENLNLAFGSDWSSGNEEPTQPAH